MNTPNTEEMITRAAQMVAFGVREDDVAATFRKEGASEEAIFLVVAAARLFAR